MKKWAWEKSEFQNDLGETQIGRVWGEVVIEKHKIKRRKMEFKFRKSKNLEAQAKNTFGDIVKSAYFCSSYPNYDGNDDIIQELDYFEKSCHDYYDMIDLDGRTIIIEFINNRKVVFSASEWGNIQDIDDIKDDTFEELK